MLKTRSYEMVRSSGNLIQWRKNLFDTVLVYNNKNKPMLRYKFGSVYLHEHVSNGVGPQVLPTLVTALPLICTTSTNIIWSHDYKYKYKIHKCRVLILIYVLF